LTRSETNATINLLVVQRDDAQAAIIRDVFGGRDDFIVSHCADLASARLALKRAAPAPDVVLADLELADGQATALFADGPLPVVVLAPGGDEARAVQAIKAGALDYVVKGPATLSNLPDIVRRARREWNVRLEREATQAQLAEKTSALEQMNDRLRMLLLLAQRVTLATSVDDCLDQFVRALSRELSAHSPKVWKGASDPESTDLAIRRAAEVARLQRRVTPYEDAEAEEARRFGLFVPIPPHGERSGLISLRRSQPFSAQDHVVAGLAVSFLEAALRSQATMNELRESQAQLHQSERMKSIGQLAGGVAHDFNNMLMVMSAAAEVMADTLDRLCDERGDLS
jgi:DNA-binding NarL/FixJ family response regulator